MPGMRSGTITDRAQTSHPLSEEVLAACDTLADVMRAELIVADAPAPTTWGTVPAVAALTSPPQS